MRTIDHDAERFDPHEMTQDYAVFFLDQKEAARIRSYSGLRSYSGRTKLSR